MIELPCKHQQPLGGCASCEFHLSLVEANPAFTGMFWGKGYNHGLYRQLMVTRNPCIYLGDKVNECTPCGQAPVHACKKFGECIRIGPKGKYHSCEGCGSYDAGVFTIPDDPLPGPEQPNAKDWAKLNSTVTKHLEALHKVAGREYEIPAMEGRGFLICGGKEYWPGIVIACRMIREAGHTEPIEVWYRGLAEPIRAEQVDGLGVSLIDATKVGTRPRILRGWESKLFALYHTKLKTVCYLDADAYPVANVSSLFARAEKEGFIYWEDMAGWNDFSVKWGKVWPKGPDGITSIQGGQLFLDRALIWKELVVAHWLNQHSDFYYSHFYGDQDTWRVSFAVTGKLVTNLGRAPWPSGSCAFVCDYDGEAKIIHRCQGKLFRITDIPANKPGKYTSPNYNLPKEVEVFKHFQELVKEDNNPKVIFPEIYRRNIWDGASGVGSTLAQSRPYVKLVNRIIRGRGIKSVVDCGSGDNRVGRRIVVERYTGVDIDGVLNIPWKPWANPRRNQAFLAADIVGERDRLPDGDLLLLKDVIHHWPNSVVAEWLDWARSCGRWKYILCAHDRGQREGSDCHLGGYRALRHTMEPLAAFRPEWVMDWAHKELIEIPVLGVAPMEGRG